MYSIVSGIITKINKNKRTVQVQTSESLEPYDVKLLQFGGNVFVPLIENSSRCIVFKIMGKRSNAFCIPYDVINQEINLPFGNNGDLIQGNPYSGCKVTYKVNGDIEVQANGDNQQITINGKTISINGDNVNIESNTVNINGDSVNIGDATANALNENATMQVVIASGSSAGTYPVQIINAGQTKVKI